MNFKVNQSDIKLRGGYYTKPEIASFLLRWVLESEPRDLLEPSCGDGVFLASLTELRTTAEAPVITAFEIESTEVAKARQFAKRAGLNAKVEGRDFLSWSLERIGYPAFDAVVGNPPFIRYQYLEPELQAVSEKIFRRLDLPFTKHTNAWVPFVLTSLALLRPYGRLAMVVPAELLHVLHAQPLRTFLTRECSRILLLDPQELWFEGALQGAVLLLAERKGSTGEPCQGVAILPTRREAFLRRSPGALFRCVSYANGIVLEGKWMLALLEPGERELLARTADLPAVRRFGAVADVSVGIVTGANKFFLVPDEIVDRHRLERWAYPMFGRSEHVPGVIYNRATHEANRRAGLPSNFLWFMDERWTDLPRSVRKYLEIGEAEGLHTRYKCRTRWPWYSVPSVYAAPVGMLKRCHHFPRLICNEMNAFTTDTAYRIRPRGIRAESLVFSFVNSLTALSAELEGRHYGGGVLELVPSEIEKVLVPVVATDGKALRRLHRAFRDTPDPEELLRLQDDAVLRLTGLTADECGQLRAAWIRLRSRRQRTSPVPEDERD